MVAKFRGIDLMDLRERIALAAEFAPHERDLILDFMVLGHTEGKHTYPPDYAPGTGAKASWATDAAWRVLDRLPPDAMTVAHRWLLAGILTAELEHTAQAGMAMAELIARKQK